MLIWGKVMAASGGAGTNCVWKDAVGSKNGPLRGSWCTSLSEGVDVGGPVPPRQVPTAEFATSHFNDPQKTLTISVLTFNERLQMSSLNNSAMCWLAAGSGSN